MTQPNQQVHVSDLTSNDVLCGRGGSINAHYGNLQFRTIVSKVKEAYKSCKSNHEKATIAQGVIQTIRNMNPPGRFLKENTDFDDYWQEIGDEKAKNKVIQAMRLKKPSIRSSLRMSTQTSDSSVASSVSFLSSQSQNLKPNFRSSIITGVNGQILHVPPDQSGEVYQLHQPRFDQAPYTIPTRSYSVITASTMSSTLSSNLSSPRRLNDRVSVSFLPSDSKRISISSSDVIDDNIKVIESKFPSSLRLGGRMPSLRSSMNSRRSSMNSRSSSLDSLASFPGSTSELAAASEDDLDLVNKEEELPPSSLKKSTTISTTGLRERQMQFQKARHERSSLPPLMLVALSSFKREELLKSLRRESLMRESLISLSKLSVDMDLLATEIIASSITSKNTVKGNRASSMMSQDLIDDLIADLYDDEIVPTPSPNGSDNEEGKQIKEEGLSHYTFIEM